MKKTNTKGENVKSENKIEDLPTNFKYQGKFYLTPGEIKTVLNELKKTKHSTRNYLMIYLMYRHGFRVSELINLKYGNFLFDINRIEVNRLKDGISTTHPLLGSELRAIKKYIRIRKPKNKHDYFFLTERKEPFSRKGINYILKEVEKKTNIRVTPHMIRHSTGFYMANKGLSLRTIQEYLGHKNVKSTVIYTQIAGHKFNNIWDE